MTILEFGSGRDKPQRMALAHIFAFGPPDKIGLQIQQQLLTVEFVFTISAKNGSLPSTCKSLMCGIALRTTACYPFSADVKISITSPSMRVHPSFGVGRTFESQLFRQRRLPFEMLVACLLLRVHGYGDQRYALPEAARAMSPKQNHHRVSDRRHVAQAEANEVTHSLDRFPCSELEITELRALMCTIKVRPR